MGRHIPLALTLALFVGAALRLWQLGSVPPGLHADEALVGYTTYSVLKTGRDLAGNMDVFALHDTNVGGTYPPLLSYLLVPFVAIGGLSPFIVRLPSALLGVISVYVVYRIVFMLFRQETTASAAAWFIALNPWSIHLSRQAQLESLSLTLVLIGIWLFLRADRRPVFVVLACISWGLSLFSYDAPRAFLPPMIALLFWYRWRKIRLEKALFVGLGIFTLLYGIFMYRAVFRGESAEYTRSVIVNATSVSGLVNRGRTMSRAPSWASLFMHNKATGTVRTVLTNYVSIFSINWFFVNGYGNLQQSVGNHGQYHVFELPLFFIGWYVLFRRFGRIGLLLMGWMLLGALPGGLSSGSLAYRASLMLPVPIIVSAVGCHQVLRYIVARNGYAKAMLSVAAIGSVAVVLSFYLFTYFFDYPVYASEAWAKQQNDAIHFAVSRAHDYRYVFIDGGLSWANQYAFFYTVEPSEFVRRSQHPEILGGKTYYRFGNLYFRDVTDEERLLPRASDAFPPDSMVITIGADDVFPNSAVNARFLAPGGGYATFKAVETD